VGHHLFVDDRAEAEARVTAFCASPMLEKREARTLLVMAMAVSLIGCLAGAGVWWRQTSIGQYLVASALLPFVLLIPLSWYVQWSVGERVNVNGGAIPSPFRSRRIYRAIFSWDTARSADRWADWYPIGGRAWRTGIVVVPVCCTAFSGLAWAIVGR
jgi:hypothetical protein